MQVTYLPREVLPFVKLNLKAGNMSAGDAPVSSFSSTDTCSVNNLLDRSMILMLVGTFFKAVPSADLASPNTAAAQSTSGNNNAATQLSEAIDEFLVDVEKKFKVMNDEVLTKCLQ